MINSPIIRSGQDQFKRDRFDNVLIQAVDEVFSSFGDAIREVLYNSLEVEFNIMRTEIPLKILEFGNSIKAIFGISAGIVELKIIESIHRSMQSYVYYGKNDLFFTDYLTTLKGSMQF